MTSVTDNESASRFELHLNGDVAGWIDYRRSGDVVALTHAEVLPELRNRGLGEEMVRDALADLRQRGLRAQAVCPFVRSYVRRHPEALPG
jgi:predicted GNAT family acetyltransferase